MEKTIENLLKRLKADPDLRAKANEIVSRNVLGLVDEINVLLPDGIKAILNFATKLEGDCMVKITPQIYFAVAKDGTQNVNIKSPKSSRIILDNAGQMSSITPADIQKSGNDNHGFITFTHEGASTCASQIRNGDLRLLISHILLTVARDRIDNSKLVKPHAFDESKFDRSHYLTNPVPQINL
jgi:hypothetical protein